MNSAEPPEAQEYLILLIDDEPHNLGVLSTILERKGVELLTARSGERGLEVAALNDPDLILLDVMMPGIDGFETCRRLKAEAMTAEIPVIFMTILDDLESKLEGFQTGAVDYLSKPFQEEEVAARVGKHVEIHRLQQALRVRNEELEEKNQQLEAFSHTVAHNLKTPMAQVKSISDTLLDVGFDSPEFMKLARNFIPLLSRSSLKLLNTVDALLLLARIEKVQLPEVMNRIDIRKSAEEALEVLAAALEEAGAEVSLEGDSWPEAIGYAPWIVEVWKNYISNAAKYGGTPPSIRLGATAHSDYVEYWAADNGATLDPAQCNRLFIPFSRLHRNSVEGHGLGLSIVHRILQAHDGDVGVELTPGEGSRFHFRLPTG